MDMANNNICPGHIQKGAKQFLINCFETEIKKKGGGDSEVNVTKKLKVKKNHCYS